MRGKWTALGLVAALSFGLAACGTVGGLLDRSDTGETARSTSGKRVSKQGVGGLRPRETVKKRENYQASSARRSRQEEHSTAPQEEATAALAPVQPSSTPAGLAISSAQENLEAVVSRAAISQNQFGNVQRRHLRNIAQYEIAQNALVSQLDAGALSGDPVLLGQWNTTQAALGQITSDLNGLSAAAASLRGETANLDALKAQLPSDTAIASEDAKQFGILRSNITETENSLEITLSRIAPLIEEKERFLKEAQSDLRRLEPKVRGN